MQPAGTFNMHNQAQLLTFTTAQPEVKEILNPRDQEKRASERCGHWRQRGKSPENSAHIHRFFKRQGRNVLASVKTAQIIPHTIISMLRSIPASSCVCLPRFSSAGVVSKENLSGCGLTALNLNERFTWEKWRSSEMTGHSVKPSLQRTARHT